MKNKKTQKYVILDRELREFFADESGEIKEYKSIAAAKKDILDQAELDYHASSEIDTEDLENWGSDHMICQVVEVVRPVPDVKIKINLKQI